MSPSVTLPLSAAPSAPVAGFGAAASIIITPASGLIISLGAAAS
jgi:hypothetical protein